MSLISEVKVGTIIDWIDGRRFEVDSASTLKDFWYIRDVANLNGGLFGLADQDIKSYGSMCRIQPGQTWVSDPMLIGATKHTIKIVGPAGKDSWNIEWVDKAQRLILADAAVLCFILVQGASGKQHGHGPHKCTRCGSDGAQILFRMIDCMNPKCRWFKPIAGGVI